MKRNTILATAAAITMLAVPAMAQPYGGGFRDKRRARPPVQEPAPYIEMPSVSSFGPHAVEAGATVTIYGSGFARGTMVKLGGQLIAPSFVGARRIMFTVPAGADDGALKLVLPNRRRALAVGALDVIKPIVRPRSRFYRDNSWYRTRRNRRQSSRRAIFSRWNNRFFLNSRAARHELAIHGRRLAKLNRMKRLARATGRAHLAVRINRAIARENARHDRKMKQLERTFLASYRPVRRF